MNLLSELFKVMCEKNYYGQPEIYDTACIGRIVSAEWLDDNRYNIVMYGLKRIRINEIEKELPHRVARVSVVEDVHKSNENIYTQRILDLVFRWNSMLGGDQESHKIKD